MVESFQRARFENLPLLTAGGNALVNLADLARQSRVGMGALRVTSN